MAKLPFLVEPRLKPRKEIVGTDISGKIEIERKGFLTAAERAFIQSQVNEDDTTQGMVRLTRLIGHEHKIDMQTAYEALTRAMQGETEGALESAIYDKHSKEIEEMISKISSMNERKILVQALCMLLYRVDSEIEAEDVMNMHPDLLEALSDLYMDEETKSTHRLQELTEEDGGFEGDANLIDELEKK